MPVGGRGSRQWGTRLELAVGSAMDRGLLWLLVHARLRIEAWGGSPGSGLPDLVALGNSTKGGIGMGLTVCRNALRESCHVARIQICTDGLMGHVVDIRCDRVDM
jgi:hypothetical protein